MNARVGRLLALLVIMAGSLPAKGLAQNAPALRDFDAEIEKNIRQVLADWVR